jgi:hypothetical protein
MRTEVKTSVSVLVLEVELKLSILDSSYYQSGHSSCFAKGGWPRQNYVKDFLSILPITNNLSSDYWLVISDFVNVKCIVYSFS